MTESFLGSSAILYALYASHRILESLYVCKWVWHRIVVGHISTMNSVNVTGL